MPIGRNGLETQAKALIASVIRPYIPFTLEPRNFTLNLFQDFVFTHIKQKQQCLCNYGLLKLFQWINQAENNH